MITNTNLGNLFFALTLTLTVSSCGSGDKKEETSADSVATTTEIPAEHPAEQPAGSTETFKDFDWKTVPQSASEIGSFPYLTAPAGFIITDKGGSNESPTGYSEMKEFNKLIMFTGQSFYNAEGKVAKLKFVMKDKESDWNQYSFDRSVDKYMQSIGAKLIGKLKVNQAQKEFLGKDDDMAIYNHIIGDPYNDPVRMYALNHSKGKIMFQVYSNSATGDVGVVELGEFEQTIKAPTAANP
jgi:hypothetical protein